MRTWSNSDFRWIAEQDKYRGRLHLNGHNCNFRPMEEKLYEIARRRVAEKKGFYRHFSVYLAVGAFFFITNVFTYPNSYEWWWFFPMAPWGAGLGIHYFSVFGLPGGALSREWEERELRRELDRLRTTVYRLEGPEQSSELQLPSLSEKDLKRRSRWNDDELV